MRASRWRRRNDAIAASLAALLTLGACSQGEQRQQPSPTASSNVATTARPTATPAAPSAPSSGSTAPCHNDQLVLSLGGGGGALGTTYVDLVVTNRSKHTCFVKGYPTVTVVDENSDPLGKSAEHDPQNPVVPVRLDHARSAHAAIGFPVAANFDPGTCTPEGSGIKVTLPTGGPPQFFVWKEASCPGFHVSAFSDWE